MASERRGCFPFTDIIIFTKYKLGTGANLEMEWLAQISVSIDDSVSKLSLNVSALTNVASLR